MSIQENRFGTIMIVDISGYSRFVEQTDDQQAGAGIISCLLKTLMGVNELSLEISEIEGDAILFYKYGNPPSAKAILSQFEKMLTAFKHEIDQLSITNPQVLNMSIKLVASYGKLIEFSVDGFRKLYGQVVIEAHRLLKNHIDSHTYALITDKLLSAANSCQEIPDGQQKMCELYDVGEVCYRYFSYNYKNVL